MFAANRPAPAVETTAEAAGAPAGPAGGVPAGSAARPAARPKLRHKRYPLMNQLSAEQVCLFRTIANTYQALAAARTWDAVGKHAGADVRAGRLLGLSAGQKCRHRPGVIATAVAMRTRFVTRQPA